MCKIIIAVAQYLDGINHLFSGIRADPDSLYKPPADFDLDYVKQTENQVVFVAQDNRQVIGYLRLHSDRSFQKDEFATFEMGVHPNSRRNGCATSLVNYALQFVKDKTMLQCLKIGVLKKNHKANSLFIKLGFRYLNQSHPKGDDMVMYIER